MDETARSGAVEPRRPTGCPSIELLGGKQAEGGVGAENKPRDGRGDTGRVEGDREAGWRVADGDGGEQGGVQVFKVVMDVPQRGGAQGTREAILCGWLVKFVNERFSGDSAAKVSRKTCSAIVGNETFLHLSLKTSSSAPASRQRSTTSPMSTAF